MTGRIEASGATPDSARPLPSTSATVPATCVPWPLSSAASSLRASTFQPGSRRPSRSGAGATPVSTTATTTPAPRVSGPGRVGADGVEAPLLRAARIRRRVGERLQPAQRLGVAHRARAPQHAQRGGPVAGATCTTTTRSRGTAPTCTAPAASSAVAASAPGRRPTTIGVGRVRDAGNEQPEQRTRTEERAGGGSVRHGKSVARGRVTAQARRVPDV